MLSCGASGCPECPGTNKAWSWLGRDSEVPTQYNISEPYSTTNTNQSHSYKPNPFSQFLALINSILTNYAAKSSFITTAALIIYIFSPLSQTELQRRSSKVLEKRSLWSLLKVGNLYQSSTTLGLDPVSSGPPQTD